MLDGTYWIMTDKPSSLNSSGKPAILTISTLCDNHLTSEVLGTTERYSML